MVDGQRETPQHPLDARLAALAAFLPKFERKGFRFGRWVQPPGTRRDSPTMPGYVLYKTAAAFVEAAYAYGWVSLEVDWMTWSRSVRGEALLENRDAIGVATVEELTCLLTTFIRSERFCEGALAGYYKDGRLTAVVRRAAELLGEIQARSSPAG